MENPEPVREHRALEKLAGHYSGPERMHPSYFNAEERKARAVTDARVTLDGFAVVQDYVQELEDGTRFAGHGVFRYDMPSDTYEMHWFDSTGGPQRIFRGGFADNMLVMTARVGDGWQRLSYDFNLDGGYRFRLETSEDGNQWNVALEGDNFAEQAKPARKRQAATREGARTAGKKRAMKKAAGRKTAARAAPKKKAAAGKKTAKKTAAKKRSAAKKTTGKKKIPLRAAAKKKAAAGKAAAKKSSARKAAGKKTSAKKSSAKKAGSRKTATRKTAKKAGAKVRVSALERDRRRGKASKKIGPKKKAAAGSATRRAVSQKKTQSSAKEAPRMPTLKKTSTRVGRTRTAAKGKRGN